MMHQPDTISPSYGSMSPDSSSSEVDVKPIQVKLLDEDHLWTQFNQLGTEMIVTKPGRQMFPTVKVLLQNLIPFAYYKLYMEVIPVGYTRYKFEKGKWQPKENSGTSFLQSSWLPHPDSPAPGFKWMLKPVDFNAKLTNCLERMDKETLWLRSMQKYMIVIHVEEGTNITNRNPLQSRAFPFPETAFFAVTSYQNPLVKDLKIEKNIHAKGARHKRVKCTEYSDENINEKVSDNAKRPRVDSYFFPSPLSSGNRTTQNHPMALNMLPISPAPAFCSVPADFIKWENPYFSPEFRYHVMPSLNRDRLPFVSPLSTLCPPTYFHCKRSQDYTVQPQSFLPFGHSPSSSLLSVYPNRVNPPNFGCSAVSNELPPLRVCPTCLNNRGTHGGSLDVNRNDCISPSSTTDAVALPPVPGAKSRTPSPESAVVHESSSVDENQLSSDNMSSEHFPSTMKEFLSSIAEAIKSSESPLNSESPVGF